MAYHQELPQTSAIHPVFHVSQLRPAHGSFTPTGPLPPQLSTELKLLVVPEHLLAIRPLRKGINTDLEVLIKWKDLPNHEVTWEMYDLVCAQFLGLHLEDKVKVWAGGIDKPPPLPFTYFRKRCRLELIKQMIRVIWSAQRIKWSARVKHNSNSRPT
jgi:hypothetical protein